MLAEAAPRVEQEFVDGLALEQRGSEGVYERLVPEVAEDGANVRRIVRILRPKRAGKFTRSLAAGIQA